jgi:DNA-binding IclR family transcriptional regulator
MVRNQVSPDESHGSGAGESRTLLRGLDILRLFNPDRPVLTQSQIAEALGLPLPTVGRLCRALVGTGFLQTEVGSRRLQLGPQIRLLAGVVPGGVPGDTRRWMEHLSERFEEDVNLALLDGVHVLYIDTRSSSHRLAVHTTIGSRAPATCTAVGKVLLAQLEDEVVLDRLGPGPYERRTEHTIRHWSGLREELAKIRRTGIATSYEEFELGLVGFAVALPPGGAEAPLAVSIAVPAVRLDDARANAIKAALLAGSVAPFDGDDHRAD